MTDLCDNMRDRLLDEAYGLLDATEAAALAAHLASCANCQLERETALRQKDLLGRAARSEFAEAVFTPPPESPVEVAPPRPQFLEPAQESIRTVWLRRVVAATLVLFLSAFGVPAAIDSFRFLAARPGIDTEYAHWEQLRQSVQELRVACTKAQQDAEAVHAENVQKRELLIENWFQEEERAVRSEADKPFYVDVFGPASAVPGAPNTYQVHVSDRLGQPKRTLLDAEVVDATGKSLFKLSKIAANGEIQLRIPASVWAQAKGDPTLRVTASEEAASISVAEKIRLHAAQFTTLLTTDRSLYRPGEKLYFRSTTLDRNTFQPPTFETVLGIVLTGPDGRTIAEQVGADSPVSENGGKREAIKGPDGQPLKGIGTGVFDLPADLADGDYTLTLWDASNVIGRRVAAKPLAERHLRVEKFVPQRFEKRLIYGGKTFGPGEEVTLHVEVKDQGKPRENLAIEWTIQLDDQLIKRETGLTHEDGIASLAFRLPKRDTLRTAQVTATVTEGATREKISRFVPLSSKIVDLEFFPEGGDLVAGVPCRVYFSATGSNGLPMDVAGHLSDGTQRLVDFKTVTDPNEPGVNQGCGVFTFTPEAGKRYHAVLDQPLGAVQPKLESGKPGFLLPEVHPNGVVMTVAQGVTKGAEPITVQLQSAGKERRRLVVGAYVRGRSVATQTVEVKAGHPAEVVLPMNSTPQGGVARITVFEEENDGGVGSESLRPVAERLVFRRPQESLALSVNAAPASGKGPIQPGDEVRLEIEAKEESGKSCPAILWAAVIDRDVLAQADDRTIRHAPAHFLLCGEIKNPEELEGAEFLLRDDRRAAESLDLLLGTQGWRRFAEQQPELFRRRFRADADRLFLASNDSGPLPRSWRESVRRVYDEFRPKYEAAELEAELSQSKLSGAGWSELTDALHKAEYGTRSAEHQLSTTISRIAFPLHRMADRRSNLPFTLAFLFGVALATFVARNLFEQGSTERRLILRGSWGFATLAFLLLGMTQLDAPWSELSPSKMNSSAPIHQRASETVGAIKDAAVLRKEASGADALEERPTEQVRDSDEKLTKISERPENSTPKEGAWDQPKEDSRRVESGADKPLAESKQESGPPRAAITSPTAPPNALPSPQKGFAGEGKGGTRRLWEGPGQGGVTPLGARGASGDSRADRSHAKRKDYAWDAKDAKEDESGNKKNVEPGKIQGKPGRNLVNENDTLAKEGSGKDGGGSAKMERQAVEGSDNNFFSTPPREFGESMTRKVGQAIYPTKLSRLQLKQRAKLDKGFRAPPLPFHPRVEALRDEYLRATYAARPLVVREYVQKKESSDPLPPSATLLWRPIIVLPASGKAIETFYLPRGPRAVEVILSGNTLDGRLGAVERTIEVHESPNP